MNILLFVFLYAFDLFNLATRRSTKRIRELQYWIEKVPSLDDENPTADITTKSYQYLPGFRVFIGSLPRYSSIAGMLAALQYLPELDFIYQLGIGLVCFLGIDYVLGVILRYYCHCVYSKKHQHKQVGYNEL